MTTTVSRTTRAIAATIPPAMAPAEFAPPEEEGCPEAVVEVGWVPEGIVKEIDHLKRIILFIKKKLN